MSPEPTLQSHIRAQFQLAFGPPHRTVGHDDQWQLDCKGTVALNILVTGGAEHPTIWVFAAHDPATGVFGKAITAKDEVPEVIRHIRKRLDLPLPVTPAEESTGYAVSAEAQPASMPGSEAGCASRDGNVIRKASAMR